MQRVKTILLGDSLWARVFSEIFNLPLISEKIPFLPRFLPSSILEILPKEERGKLSFAEINAAVYLGEYMIPYPLQLLFYELPQRAKMELLRDYLNAYHRRETRPSNLKEWFEASFGRSMAELFFIPYNEKLWGFPLERLSYAWAEDLNPRPSPEEVFFGSQGKMEALKKTPEVFALQEEDHIFREVKDYPGPVLEIELKERRLKTENQSFRYENLVSFIPLDRLLSLLKPAERIFQLAMEFLQKSPRFYLIAEADSCPPYRKVYFPHSPQPFSKFLCFQSGKVVVEVPGQEDVSAEEVFSALKHTGLLKGEVRKIKTVSSFLPLPTPETYMMREGVLHKLQNEGILSVGIWGRWEYMGAEKELSSVRDALSLLIGVES